MAVGPNHIIGVVNSQFRISDKQGNTIVTVDANSWYRTVLENPSTFDPKVIYDHYDNRWVMVWLHADKVKSESYFLISVSDDEDPTGVWYNWALPSHQNGNTLSGNWGDYQGVGFDSEALYITSNQFPFTEGGSNYTKLRIIDKRDLYISGQPGEVKWNDIWDFKYPGSSYSAFGVRPTRMYSESDAFYLVITGRYITNSSVGVFKITNPLTDFKMESTAVPVVAYSQPVDPEQLGGGDKPLENFGSRLCNEPIFHNGGLYFACETNFNDKIGIKFVVLDEDLTVVKDMVYGNAEHHHFYPAIAVNKNDNVLLTFSRSSANEYVGAYYTILQGNNWEPIGTIPIMEGKGNYVKTFSGDRNRWGDYMGAWVDPIYQENFWLYTQYAEKSNSWAVWTAGIRPISDTPFLYMVNNKCEFGEIEINNSSNQKSVMIFNAGNNPLEISQINSSDKAFKAHLDKSLPISLLKGDTLVVKIDFHPTEHKEYSSTINIVSNDETISDDLIEVKGTGYKVIPALENKLYAVTGSASTGGGVLLSLDKENAQATEIGSSGISAFAGLTINPNNGYLIGVEKSVNGNLIKLSSIDGHGYLLTQPLVPVIALAYTTNGDLFAISKENEIYQLDSETFDTTYIATIPVNVNAMTFDLNDNMLIVSKDSGLKGKIYSVSASGDTSLYADTKIAQKFEGLTIDDKGVIYASYGTMFKYSQIISYDPSTDITTEIGASNYKGIFGLLYVRNGFTSVESDISIVPNDFVLKQNYPNPFNPSTRIEFSVPVSGNAKLSIYNVVGERIAVLLNKSLQAGRHTVEWNAAGNNLNLSSGVYLYRLDFKGSNGKSFTESKKMMLVK